MPNGEARSFCVDGYNYALGEKVDEVIRQYADGSLTAEKERDLRKAGFKFDRMIR